MIIPEDIRQQGEICKIEIPSFYANKRIIGISMIIQELANNYLNGKTIWSYYARDQLMIYSNSRELRKALIFDEICGISQFMFILFDVLNLSFTISKSSSINYSF